jgi:hypothetical protein
VQCDPALSPKLEMNEKRWMKIQYIGLKVTKKRTHQRSQLLC